MTATLLGTVPLTVGSSYQFTDALTKDGATWDLSGQTVTLWFGRPNGTTFAVTATGATQATTASINATYTGDGSELNIAGTWNVAWHVAGFGFYQPRQFTVIYAPLRRP